MELSKMESNIPVSFCGDIAYIKYQHPGGDSPEIPSPVKQFAKQDILPQSKEKIIAREASSKFERVPSKVRRTKSSPSYDRRPRRGPSHRRRQHMINVVEDAGPFADRAIRRSKWQQSLASQEHVGKNWYKVVNSSHRMVIGHGMYVTSG